ncbi:uncharacterized protein AC631_02242 [Debaryomyces fabryi]|uniref:tRNA wybutosine-synthesizing protein 2 n=1 Tax=Debaryomyces fabryi TaxID=58627 RepID=A0A0V1Q0I2_9ASCO|nr:uncharacterized protein AC631_02242 [Debaryomyces fabryi]KSA02029.1 hypothetical protein AC631_02242 [Debaryomyces fabryi]CUM51374.1 unnamed protein product [Debaryomyces fabryi]
MTRCIVIGIENAVQIKSVKVFLEELGVFNRNKKISKSGNLHQLYTTCENIDELEGIPEKDIEIGYYEADEGHRRTLEAVVRELLTKKEVGEDIETLMQHVPKKWSVYPPMILLNSGTFDTDTWTRLFEDVGIKDEFFRHILLSGVFPSGLTHIAVNKPIIEEDVMRRPFNILPVYGDFGPEPSEKMFDDPTEEDFERAFWCSAVQNGIYQTWAPRFTMFSRGNIKEKKRVLEECKDANKKCVFDLYAGIGYFTLSYLRNGATVFCWEINPWSIQGLIKSVTQNGYKYKLIGRQDLFDHTSYTNCDQDGVVIYIFHESNEFAMDRYLQFQKILPIAHINLGLLPTSVPSWPTTKALVQNSSTGTVIHVHENVHVDDFVKIGQKAASYFEGNMIAINRVKTFAPDIWHVVIDISLK